jgi:hypothetical protein
VPASKAQQATTAERRRRAVQMRLAGGVTWEQIAKECGYSGKAAACKDVTRALDQERSLLRLSTEDLRTVEIARLDRLQRGHWPNALDGDIKATEVVLKIIAQRVRLLGLEGTDEERDRIRAEVIREVSGQAFSVIGYVLDGLGISGEQRSLAPGLIQQAVGKFDDRSRDIEGEVA